MDVSSEIKSALPSEVLLLREFSWFAKESAFSFPGMPTWLGTQQILTLVPPLFKFREVLIIFFNDVVFVLYRAVKCFQDWFGVGEDGEFGNIFLVGVRNFHGSKDTESFGCEDWSSFFRPGFLLLLYPRRGGLQHRSYSLFLYLAIRLFRLFSWCWICFCIHRRGILLSPGWIGLPFWKFWDSRWW